MNEIVFANEGKGQNKRQTPEANQIPKRNWNGPVETCTDGSSDFGSCEEDGAPVSLWMGLKVLAASK